MGRPRSGTAIKYDAELGVALYGPTPATPRYRLDYVDPFTGRRCQPGRVEETDAFALWDDSVTYLRNARLAAPVGSVPGVRRAPKVDDLFERLLEGWEADDRSPRYIDTRAGLYDYRLRPVFGDWAVREWAASNGGCQEVVRAARAQGLAPASVQNLGSLMRTMVTLAWDLRWIRADDNPMRRVRYVAKSTDHGEGVEFVREDDRPEFGAVDKLLVAYDELAELTGIFWLPDRARVGAYGGLRPSERDALRLRDLHPETLSVSVEHAFCWPRGADGPVRRAPKNGKRREVLLPASTIEHLEDVAERRRKAGAGPAALLFEDPGRPGLPISEAATRRLHIDAALRAGWDWVEVRRRADSRRQLGPDRRPRHTNYSLRHHAAVWMHDVAGFDWADVSRALGHHSVAFTFAVYVRSGTEADARNRARLQAM